MPTKFGFGKYLIVSIAGSPVLGTVENCSIIPYLNNANSLSTLVCPISLAQEKVLQSSPLQNSAKQRKTQIIRNFYC